MLALLDEADRHRIRDAVRRRFVGIEHAREHLLVRTVLGEQRAGEHVAEQQHDTDHFVRLDASRDDALGQVARVGLKGLDRTGFEGPEVVVIDGTDLGEDFVVGHRSQEAGAHDAACPLLA